MFKNVSWKLKEHSELKKHGIDHSVFLDIISRENKKVYFDYWRNLEKLVISSLGLKFTDRTPMGALREVFVEGIYDVDGFRPKTGDVVVDFGANFGDSSIWWAKRFGAKVIAFEPLPDVFHELQANIQINKADVIAYNVALGNGNFIKGNKQGDMLVAGGQTEIPTSRLDDYTFDRLDLLKIDVEGFEYDVLLGAKSTISRFKPKIILETHSIALRKLCHRFLTSLGYSLSIKGRTVKVHSPGMDEITNLFYSPMV